MSGRVEIDPSASATLAPSQPGIVGVAGPLALDPDDRFAGPSLPSDHPAWMRDAVALSARARALIATVKPVVVRVIAAWEHRVRSIVIGGRTLKIDASGSYRLP